MEPKDVQIIERISFRERKGIEKECEKGLEQGKSAKAIKAAKGMIKAGVNIEMFVHVNGLKKGEIKS